VQVFQAQGEIMHSMFKPWALSCTFEGSVVNVGLGRQRRRLSLYINKAPLCGNGRRLRTHQSCDLGFAGPGREGETGFRTACLDPQAVLNPGHTAATLRARSSTSASVVNVGASLFILIRPPYVEMAAG
jgi:hypothetical protein